MLGGSNMPSRILSNFKSSKMKPTWNYRVPICEQSVDSTINILICYNPIVISCLYIHVKELNLLCIMDTTSFYVIGIEVTTVEITASSESSCYSIISVLCITACIYTITTQDSKTYFCVFKISFIAPQSLTYIIQGRHLSHNEEI